VIYKNEQCAFFFGAQRHWSHFIFLLKCSLDRVSSLCRCHKESRTPLTSNIPGILTGASPLSLLGHYTFLLLPSRHVLSNVVQLFLSGYLIESLRSYRLPSFDSLRAVSLSLSWVRLHSWRRLVLLQPREILFTVANVTTIFISKISCVFPTRHIMHS
jgi:hypothetical protein